MTNQEKISSCLEDLQKGYTKLLEMISNKDFRDEMRDTYISNLHDYAKQLFELMSKINT